MSMVKATGKGLKPLILVVKVDGSVSSGSWFTGI